MGSKVLFDISEIEWYAICEQLEIRTKYCDNDK